MNIRHAQEDDAPVGGVPTNLWQNRAFLRLWIADVLSNSGSEITAVALPLLFSPVRHLHKLADVDEDRPGSL